MKGGKKRGVGLESSLHVGLERFIGLQELSARNQWYTL